MDECFMLKKGDKLDVGETLVKGHILVNLQNLEWSQCHKKGVKMGSTHLKIILSVKRALIKNDFYKKTNSLGSHNDQVLNHWLTLINHSDLLTC
jgi:hypothetical protein